METLQAGRANQALPVVAAELSPGAYLGLVGGGHEAGGEADAGAARVLHDDLDNGCEDEDQVKQVPGPLEIMLAQSCYLHTGLFRVKI